MVRTSPGSSSIGSTSLATTRILYHCTSHEPHCLQLTTAGIGRFRGGGPPQLRRAAGRKATPRRPACEARAGDPVPMRLAGTSTRLRRSRLRRREGPEVVDDRGRASARGRTADGQAIRHLLPAPGDKQLLMFQLHIPTAGHQAKPLRWDLPGTMSWPVPRIHPTMSMLYTNVVTAACHNRGAPLCRHSLSPMRPHARMGAGRRLPVPAVAPG